MSGCQVLILAMLAVHPSGGATEFYGLAARPAVLHLDYPSPLKPARATDSSPRRQPWEHVCPFIMMSLRRAAKQKSARVQDGEASRRPGRYLCGTIPKKRAGNTLEDSRSQPLLAHHKLPRKPNVKRFNPIRNQIILPHTPVASRLNSRRMCATM